MPPALIERISYYQAPQAPEAEQESSAIPFAHYRWMINRHKWRLLLFVAVAVGATVMVSTRLTKYYESTVTIDVDRTAPQGVIGQDAVVGRAAAVNDSELFLQTQIQLIKSPSVLDPVKEKLKRRAAATGQKIDSTMSRLAVNRPPRTYLLLISYRSPNPQLAAEVANDIADSYIDHSYQIRGQDQERQSIFMQRQLEDLKAKMESSAAALLQAQKELGVINPDQKTDTQSPRLIQLNTDWTNAQTDLIKKEAADKSVRSGSVEALEASAQGDELKKLEETMADEA
ncbi:MAG: hypothetical protein KGN84_02245, partial [Acidobacteriota bacterium]|nr:hypothetical protein [Acidobacteriota bacterium]